MTQHHDRDAEDETGSASPRQRAIEAYDSARERAVDTLGDAPLFALAGGIAAGALIAALLPRTGLETRLVRPTARRVKDSARAAFVAGGNFARLVGLDDQAARKRIADDEFAQERRQTGMQAPYSNWRRYLKEHPTGVAA